MGESHPSLRRTHTHMHARTHTHAHTQILPLENKMKHPHHAKWVILGGMTLVIILYVIFAILGYLVYGNAILASITLNLRSKERIGAAT